MFLISTWRKRAAIKAYSRKLGPRLTERYGKSETYTEKQIESTARDCGLSMTYISFAYAMFMLRDPFDALHRELGETCDYAAMRQEVADTCFSGNTDFPAAEGASFHDLPGRDFGGSFDGGGYDGGGSF